MDDTALDATVGQAYIEMESYTDLATNQVSRVTFGQTIKVQANADSLTLGGGYDNGINTGTDFSATNFSLGYVDTATNEIVPFVITDPYFEWVTDTNNNLVGFRMGAGEAKGVLQMDMTSFSGNIDMTINGVASSLFTTTDGSITNSRATMIGTTSGACDNSITTSCVSITNIQKLDVENPDGLGDPTADFFLSFQKTDLEWNTSASTQVASKGFFMNIPTNTNLNVSSAASSTDKFATEFINRGVGRWNTAATP